MSWEDTFKSWGSPPGTTEQQKMENTESAIRKAINANTKLASMDISIIPQGSYKSKTNVKNDSDVDVCVCLNSTFFPRYPEGKKKEDYGNSDGSISFSEFKNLVQKALEDYFGKSSVTRGNKAFDIHSNTYRVDADVVPAFAYRYYYDTGSDWHQPEGICFLSDDGSKIINWPHQTYENCKSKQESTGQRYRKVARILKRLRNKMQDENISASKDIPSFLIQCMVWSASDDCFNRDTYTADVRAVLAHCFNETLEKGRHATLCEVNNIKYIFGAHQSCKREQAHAFFSAAWNHIGFKD
jgi:hypothetical protein